MMPLKHKICLTVILGVGILVLSLSSHSHEVLVKSILLYTVLTFASYLDYRFRIIPDWMHIVFIAIGFINIDVAKALFGLVISPLPFLIMVLINQGSIGGGDLSLLELQLL